MSFLGGIKLVVNNFCRKQWVCRGIFVVFLFLLIPFYGFSQNPNSWIDFTQTYYKIPVSKDGMYRLTYSDLQAAGFPVGGVDPRRIQIFHRGVEQAIFVQGQADAVLNDSDYVEFFGQRNDGMRDANLYKPSSLQPHSYYNIYSDTSAYFLTWNFASQGKRMSTFSEVNVSNIPKETFHNQERLKVLSDQYSGGYTVSDELQYTQFDQGEGFTGIALRQGQTVDYSLDLLSNTFQPGGLPQLEVLLVGRDNISHSSEIYVGPTTGALRLVDSRDFLGFETIKVSASLNWSDIGSDGKMVVRVGAVGSGTQRNQLSVSYIKVNFPQGFSISGETEKIFHLQVNVNGKSYVELNNPVAGLRIWDITDSNNLITIGTQTSGSIMSAVVSGTTSSRTLYASNTTISPTFIKQVSFRQIQPADHNYLIISHRSLMKPASGYGDVVRDYAAYRASSEGGGYDTLVVSMDQLYNQFNYGETSSLAIYEFLKFMVNGGTPQYLFLIGKGRDVYSHRSSELSANDYKDLIPAAGAPGSDMAFSAGLSGTLYEPAIPTGRLTASKPEQVAAYLNKVKETETIFKNSKEEIWRKKGLHLSGGIQAFELPYFKDVVNGFKAIAEDVYWGGKITTVSKRDLSVSQVINVSTEVNAGINILTFFGHSSPSTSDFDIGFVTNPVLGYNNPGKYPVLLFNGCNAGNSFANGIAFGEDWMMAANKGARNFIAHSSFGFTGNLQRYSDLFYEVGFGDSTFIKKGIGDVQKEVARRYIELDGVNLPNVTQVQQMVLLGDPAMKLFGSSKPDYETNDNSIYLESFDGNPVTALSDSFAVKVIVKNFGATYPLPLELKLLRKLNDGTTLEYNSTFTGPFFQDTLVIKLLKPQANGSGSNEFSVLLDPNNKIKELAEDNNTGTLVITIPSNGTKNLYPLAYSIASQPSIKFLFQDTDLLSDLRGFQMEIDTVSSFDSPYLNTYKVTGKVLGKLWITLLPKDSTVYYWRTKFDQPKAGESTDWVTSSFTLINGSPEGWAQAESEQETENKLTDLVLSANGLRFKETQADVFVRTFGSSNPSPYTSVSLKIDNSEYNLSTQGQPCRNNTINLVAFHKTTAVPYPGIPFNFQDPRTCGREPQLINSFTLAETETGHGDDIIAFIDNIDVSDSVLIFTIGDPGFLSWSANVQNKLTELGINYTDIGSLQQGEPLIIWGRKGGSSSKIFTAPGTPKPDQELQVSETVTGRAATGKMMSTVIGPAQSWKQLITNVSHVGPHDVFSFSVYASRLNGADSLIQENIVKDFDLSFLNAAHYPYLRVEVITHDDVDLTPIQIKNWMVLYEPAAEGVLLHVGEPVASTVQEGAPWSDQFKFVNISDKNFTDSLTVGVEIFNATKLSKDNNSFKIHPPAKGDSTLFEIAANTKSKVGTNDVSVFINRKLVREQYYDNNSISMTDHLIVTPDDTRPLLDVSIDGRYIQNFDYVSSSPFILATIKDENPFLFKSDTVGINILLRSPCKDQTCAFVRIDFTDPNIKWSPATSSSDFKVTYQPKNLVDGEYTLSVQASDATGNLSSIEPYEVTFQVKSETTISLQSVFPNPSDHRFYFQFQLTGNTLPDDFSLQIFMLDGSLVREFTQDDVSQFKIGLNELIWQAKDLSGNALPNGLYIYRLRLSANDKQADQQGKLVLIR